MKQRFLATIPLFAALTLAGSAGAATVNWTLGGDGNVSASGTLSFAADPNAGSDFGNPSKNAVPVSTPYSGFVGVADPLNASIITNVTGVFSDKALGVSNVAITGLVADNYLPHFAPDWTIPYSFSYNFSADNPVSYDNLFYADGLSPQTCTLPPPGDYGGYFDNYGVMFTLANGDVVDLYSNGDTLAVSSDPNNPAPPLSPAPYFYGVVVISNGVADYTSAPAVAGEPGLAFATPEPSTWVMMALGFAGVGFAGYRASRKRAVFAA
jgi:hypothetical protein